MIYFLLIVFFFMLLVIDVKNVTDIFYTIMTCIMAPTIFCSFSQIRKLLRVLAPKDIRVAYCRMGTVVVCISLIAMLNFAGTVTYLVY